MTNMTTNNHAVIADGGVCVAHPKVHPDHPTEVLTVRLSRPDYEKVRDIARAEDRPVTTQCRHLIKRALNLSADRVVREDDSQ